MKLFSKVPAQGRPDYDRISQLEDELGVVNAENYERKYDEMLIEEFEKNHGRNCEDYFREFEYRYGRYSDSYPKSERRRPIPQGLEDAYDAYQELLDDLNLESSKKAMKDRYEHRYSYRYRAW